MMSTSTWACVQCTAENKNGNPDGGSILTCIICGWTNRKSSTMLTCDCDFGIYCGLHKKLKIFEEYQMTDEYLSKNLNVYYPNDTNDLRYLVSQIDNVSQISLDTDVLPMLTKVSTQYISETSISWDSKRDVAKIIISKTTDGIGITGPEVRVFKRFYDHVMTFARPVCITVITSNMFSDKSDSGEYTVHSTVLVIYPTGHIYFIDPNCQSSICEYKSDALEAAIIKLLPDDKRFVFIPQRIWLDGSKFSINSSYEHLGISSGWCNTISAIISGAIMRFDHPIHPIDVLKYLADMPDELRIMAFAAAARIIVIHSFNPSDCKNILMKRDKPKNPPADPESDNEYRIDPSELELQRLLLEDLRILIA